MTGPFASVAVSYAEMGLHPFPCGAVSSESLVVIDVPSASNLRAAANYNVVAI